MVFSFPTRRRSASEAETEAALPGLAGPEPVMPAIDATLVQIFALVGEAIAGATHALLSSDREAAKDLVEQDELIDELTIRLSRFVEDALMGPGRSAEERQELIVILKMLPDLERNGDLAEHIARRAARGLGQEMSARSRGLVERMGEVATTIWRHTAEVVADRLPNQASAIENLDEELDDLHVTLTAEIVSGTMPIPVAIELALVARFYERFGDHAVNLARRISILSGGSGEPPISGTD
jgi:phosphate transport system protein